MFLIGGADSTMITNVMLMLAVGQDSPEAPALSIRAGAVQAGIDNLNTDMREMRTALEEALEHKRRRRLSGAGEHRYVMTEALQVHELPSGHTCNVEPDAFTTLLPTVSRGRLRSRAAVVPHSADEPASLARTAGAELIKRSRSERGAHCL